MKLGIIGTGKIVHEALYAIKPLKDIKINAIYARCHSRSKGEQIALEYGIKELYTDYDELLQNSDIDTVYIALSNHVHYEYAKKALLMNKNVILEKPFTNTWEEAKELFEIADKNGLFLFEAITIMHNGILEKMVEVLPKLGPIKMMIANYSQYSSQYDAYLNGNISPVFDPKCYGGALRDINIYNIHYAVAMFGCPLNSIYYPNKGHNGIDTSGTLILTYPSFSAVCVAAKDSDSECFVSIQGENGFMIINGKPNVSSSLTITINNTDTKEIKDNAGASVRSSSTSTFTSNETYHRMTKEFQDFSSIIDSMDYQRYKELAIETLNVMKVIDA